MRAAVVVSILVAGMAANPAAARIARQEIDAGQIGAMVRIEDVHRDGDVVRARLVNASKRTVVNVRVLVTESFRWTDERHPGPDDPSQGRAFTVPEAIRPGSVAEVTLPLPRPPARADGRFVLGASVVGLDSYPPR